MGRGIFSPVSIVGSATGPLLGACGAGAADSVLFGLLDLHNLWACAVSVLTIQGIFALVLRPQVKRVLESMGPLSVELPIVRELLEIVEREQFSSTKLHMLASALARDGLAASGKIHRLQILIRLLKERDNEVFTYVSFCLLWGTQFTMAIEHWRLRHGAELQAWVAALGEFEALISLSTYSYEHPGDTVPLLLENSQHTGGRRARSSTPR